MLVLKIIRIPQILLIAGLLTAAIATIVFYASNGSDSSGKLHEPWVADTPPLKPNYERQKKVVERGEPSGPKTGAIEIPDGTLIQVVFRERNPPRDFSRVLADQYDNLKQAALSGDASAAMLLHKGLGYCDSHRLDSKQALEDALSDLEQHRTMEFHRRDGSISSVSIDDYDNDAELDLVKNFEFCSGTTTEQRSESQRWLKQAADNGDPAAAQQFVITELHNTEEGRRYLQSAFEQGWYNAGGLLASYYSESFSKRSRLPEAEKNDAENPVLAYAYQLLVMRLLEIDFEGQEDLLTVYRKQLSDIERSISLVDRELGRIEAKKRMLDYKNCCIAIMP